MDYGSIVRKNIQVVAHQTLERPLSPYPAILLEILDKPPIMHLVLLETSGNQNYIFSTNKLKENIGASELTYRAGTKYVLDAVGKIRQQASSLWSTDAEKSADSEKLRCNLLDPTKNPPINNDTKVEVIIATSGKALLLVSDRAYGQEIVRDATFAVLKEAVGVDLCGVISDDFELGEQGGLAKAIANVYQKFDAVKAQRPSPDLRFLRLPIIDECATSGLPAARLEQDIAEGDLRPYSAVSIAKRHSHSEGEQRIFTILNHRAAELKLSQSLKFINTEDTQWLAIIHADGNGLGEIFLSFDKHLLTLLNENQVVQAKYVSDRDYIKYLREFSIALDICTEKAFVTSLKTTFWAKNSANNKASLPVAPLVLGGDDLTVVCDAKGALEFTVRFLQEFERETSESQKVGNTEITIVKGLAKVALKAKGGYLSACAGVAIVKPHFPFSVAYHLAEQLLKSAKTVKTKVINPDNDNKPYPCSAIDFHILYDSSGTDLDTIRKKQQVDHGQTRLYNSPYVVSNIDAIPENNGQAWATRHDWNALRSKAKALQLDPSQVLNSDREEKKKLSSSQVHTLRSHLYMGKASADSYYQLIKSRYDFQNLLDGKDSLFVEDPDSKIYTTSLLDAMDVMAFLNFDLSTDTAPDSHD